MTTTTTTTLSRVALLLFVLSLCTPTVQAYNDRVMESYAKRAEYARKLHAAESAVSEADRALLTHTRMGARDKVVEALDAGADINQRDVHTKQTPLMMCALGGIDDVAELLLERGADERVEEKDGYHAWHGAAFQGRPSIGALLLHWRPDFDPSEALHRDNFYPLHRALWQKTARHADMARLLLDDARARGKLDRLLTHAAGKDGSPALHVAASQSNARGVRLLGEYGVDALATNAAGLTAREYARAKHVRDDHEVIAALLELEQRQRDAAGAAGAAAAAEQAAEHDEV